MATEPAAAHRAVALRPVEPADLQHFFWQQQDREAAAMAAFPSRERDAFMAHWGRVLADATALPRTIVVAEEVAGNIGSFLHAGQREVGYWLGRPFWGRGIATAALALFLEVETTRPLHAAVAAHNHGSRRVLEKCGFAVVGEQIEDDHGAPITLILLRLDR